MRIEPIIRLWQALRFRNWRIAIKIAALLLSIALLTAAAITLFITQRSAQALSDQMRVQLQSMALGAARVFTGDLDFTIKEFGENQSTLLSALADFLAEPQAESADIFESALAFYQTYTIVKAVFIVDREGAIVATTDSALRQQPAEQPYVQRALAGDIALTAPRPDADSFFATVTLALPLRTQDAVQGALVITFRLDSFDFLLRDTLLIQQGEGTARVLRHARLYAVNAEGLVFFDSDAERAWQYSALGTPSPTTLAAYSAPEALGLLCAAENWDGLKTCPSESVQRRTALQVLPGMQPIADLARQVAESPSRGSTRYCRPEDLSSAPALGDACNGAWYLVGYAPVQTPLNGAVWLTLFAEVPEAAILEAVAEQRASGLAIAMLIVPLVIVAALLLGRTFARPIRRLSAVALAVEQGYSLDERTIAQIAERGDELGDLSRIFGNMVHALNARSEELRTIYQIGTRISSSLELRETLEFVITSLRQVIPYDWCEISLYEADRREIVPQVAADHDSLESATPRPISAMQGYLSYLITQGRGLYVPRISAFEGALWLTGRSWDTLQPQSYLGVPLKARDQLIGVIEMVGAQAGQLNADHLRVLESVAVQAAVALQNAQQVQVREAKLRQEIQELRIEIDETKKARQVAAITETEYFQQLQSRVTQLRKRAKRAADPSETQD
jgi:HAMP domain-containing protein